MLLKVPVKGGAPWRMELRCGGLMT